MPRGKRRSPVIVTTSSEEEVLFVPAVSGAKKKLPDKWQFDFVEGPLPATSMTVVSPASTQASACKFDFYNHEPMFEELAVHKKKLFKVEQWFLKFINGTNSPVLVLSGPTGCGKTACVRALGTKYKIDLIDGYAHFSEKTLNHQKDRKERLFPSLAFAVAGKDAKNTIDAEMTVCTMVRRKKLILVDDLPNPDATQIVSHIIKSGEDGDDNECSRYSTILLVTDPCGRQSLTNDAHIRVLLTHHGTTHINLNAASPTLLKRLSDKHSQEAFRSQQCGDIRAFLLNLHVDSLLSTEKSLALGADMTRRDTPLELFHALGKILHGRVDGNVAADLTDPDRSLYHSFLHANYPKYIGGNLHLESILEVADAFSLIDAAEWPVKNDPFWQSSHSTLPERIIALRTFQISPKQGFKPMIAPNRAHGRNL